MVPPQINSLGFINPGLTLHTFPYYVFFSSIDQPQTWSTCLLTENPAFLYFSIPSGNDKQFAVENGAVELVWLVVWNMTFIFPYIGNTHSNWLSYFSEEQVYHQPVVTFPIFHRFLCVHHFGEKSPTARPFFLFVFYVQVRWRSHEIIINSHEITLKSD